MKNLIQCDGGVLNGNIILERVANIGKIKSELTKLNSTITVNSVSNDLGVDVVVGTSDCAFRKILTEKGFAVARTNTANNVISLSQKMRRNRVDECVKIVAAYLLYKNGKLVNNNGEVIE